MAKFSTAKMMNGDVRHINMDRVVYIQPNANGTSSIYFSDNFSIVVATPAAELLK